MNILSIADKPGSAIDRLARMNMQRLGHLNITHVCVHPKKPDQTTINLIRAGLAKIDLVDAQYWKSATVLLDLIPELARKPIILTHHNEHNVVGDWAWRKHKWAKIVVKNGWQKDQLASQGFDPVLIRHACEFDNFKFTPTLTEEKIVGYVGQIKKVKGVREIKQACDELGYKLMVVGGVSEARYWTEMNKEGIILANNVPDNEIGGMFGQMRVYCANSDDGTESGTVPILEAMAAGIPVVTRNIGLVRDCGEDAKNMVVRKGHYTDIADLKRSLQMVMENQDIADNLRENAWRTVRQYHPDVQAREYNKLYHRTLYPGKPTVSVVIPTFNRAKVLVETLESISQQTYKNFEVLIVDDGSTDNTKGVVEHARQLYDFPLRYIQTGNFPATDGKKSYGLAQARNMGTIEAIGDIVMFCDDRLRLHAEAMAGFVERLEELEHENQTKKIWVWGNKGSFKTFVENFSAVYRRELIVGGMFSERMVEYGGMTQETSRRFGQQGFKFEWAPQALAEPIIGTHSKANKRQQIINSKIRLYKMGLI